MNNIKFSVAICVYAGDSPKKFDIALNSIVCQTMRPSEIVITIDGPIPDDTEEVIKKYENYLSDTGILLKIVRLEKNSGHGEARRICSDNCSYSFIALMDADDISVPERFEKQIALFLEQPDLSVVGGNITEFIDNEDSADVSMQAGKRVVPEKDKEIKEYMKKRCPMNQVTVMYKKVDVEEVGGYLDWYCNEDYYLWIRLALAGKKFGNVQDNLVNVRVGKEMYQRRGGMKYFISEAKLQIFMLQENLIGFPRCSLNIVERLVIQVLVPSGIRSWIFRNFAREQ